MKPGDLVQLKRGVTGQGDVGVIIGSTPTYYLDGVVVALHQVLFADGIRDVHPSNLQKPDGRTRRRA